MNERPTSVSLMESTFSSLYHSLLLLSKTSQKISTSIIINMQIEELQSSCLKTSIQQWLWYSIFKFTISIHICRVVWDLFSNLLLHGLRGRGRLASRGTAPIPALLPSLTPWSQFHLYPTESPSALVSPSLSRLKYNPSFLDVVYNQAHWLGR